MTEYSVIIKFLLGSLRVKQNLYKSRLSKSRFLLFSALVARPEKLLYTVATPSFCGLLDREMRTK